MKVDEDESEDLLENAMAREIVQEIMKFGVSQPQILQIINLLALELEEKGYDSETGNLIIAVDPRYFRPTEVEALLGDPTKVKEKLGWEPKITFEEMVHEMMECDINIAKRDTLVKEHGFMAPDFNE